MKKIKHRELLTFKIKHIFPQKKFHSWRTLEKYLPSYEEQDLSNQKGRPPNADDDSIKHGTTRHIKSATLIGGVCWGSWVNPGMSLSSALLVPAIAYPWWDVDPGSSQPQQALLPQEGCLVPMAPSAPAPGMKSWEPALLGTLWLQAELLLSERSMRRSVRVWEAGPS